MWSGALRAARRADWAVQRREGAVRPSAALRGPAWLGCHSTRCRSPRGGHEEEEEEAARSITAAARCQPVPKQLLDGAALWAHDTRQPLHPSVHPSVHPSIHHPSRAEGTTSRAERAEQERTTHHTAGRSRCPQLHQLHHTLSLCRPAATQLHAASRHLLSPMHTHSHATSQRRSHLRSMPWEPTMSDRCHCSVAPSLSPLLEPAASCA